MVKKSKHTIQEVGKWELECISCASDIEKDHILLNTINIDRIANSLEEIAKNSHYIEDYLYDISLRLKR